LGSPILLRLIPALGIIAFAVYGIEPLLRLSRILFFQVITNFPNFFISLFLPNLFYFFISSKQLAPFLICDTFSED